MRIWCVRPVFGRARTSAKPSNFSTHFVGCDGRAGGWVVAANRFLFALRGVFADRFVDHVAIEIGHADDDRQVFLFHLARFELGGQGIVRLVVLGDDDHAARVAVEAMDDTRARGAAAAAERAEVVSERAGQRSFPVAFGRMDDHAGGLVRRRSMCVVFVKNFERNVLRRGAFARDIDLLDGDDVGRPQAMRRFAVIAADANVTCVDGAANRGAANGREMRGEEHVEPLPGLFGGDREVLWPQRVRVGCHRTNAN